MRKEEEDYKKSNPQAFSYASERCLENGKEEEKQNKLRIRKNYLRIEKII